MNFIKQHLSETKKIIEKINIDAVESMVQIIKQIREENGRLFFLGVGGSAANCSHAVNDFRKLAGIEAYTPTDNIAELTARTNDEGWDSVFSSWLQISKLKKSDGIFILSVGGGDVDNNISPNLVKALKYGEEIGAKILGIVGRNGGYTAKVANSCVLIPIENEAAITPHTEALQSVLLHLLISHPSLSISQAKWESLDSE